MIRQLIFGLAAMAIGACAGPGTGEITPGRDRVRLAPMGAEAPLAGEDTAAAAAALGDALAESVAAAVPSDFLPSDAKLFKRIDRGGAVWSASPMADLDFSGVAWGGGPPVTLITDRHGIVSAHVPTKEGRTLRFVTKDGWPVERRITRKVTVPRVGPARTDLDIAVVALDAPVPAGIAVYALPDVAPGVLDALRSEEAPVIVTYRGRRAGVATFARQTNDGLRLLYAHSSKRLGLPEDAGREPAWGDSGHPSFFLLGDALILASHYHTSAGAGAGPNYAAPAVQAALRDAIDAVDAGTAEP